MAGLRVGDVATDTRATEEALGLLADLGREATQDILQEVDESSEASVLAAKADVKALADGHFRRGEDGAADRAQ